MGVLSVILYTVAVIIAILLICLVLVQPSKGGGLGSAFGGAGETVFGAQAMSHLAKLTVVLIAIFFIVTLALAAISGHKDSSSGTAADSKVLKAAAPAAEAPAAPAAAPAASTAKPAAPAAKPAAPAAKPAAPAAKPAPAK